MEDVGIFYDHLVYFSGFGMLYQNKIWQPCFRGGFTGSVAEKSHISRRRRIVFSHDKKKNTLPASTNIIILNLSTLTRDVLI
jgi:hypothetical protein